MQVAIKCGQETPLLCIPVRPPMLHTVSINVHSLLAREVNNMLLFYTCFCCTVVLGCCWASIVDLSGLVAWCMVEVTKVYHFTLSGHVFA